MGGRATITDHGYIQWLQASPEMESSLTLVFGDCSMKSDLRPPRRPGKYTTIWTIIPMTKFILITPYKIWRLLVVATLGSAGERLQFSVTLFLRGTLRGANPGRRAARSETKKNPSEKVRILKKKIQIDLKCILANISQFSLWAFSSSCHSKASVPSTASPAHFWRHCLRDLPIFAAQPDLCAPEICVLSWHFVWAWWQKNWDTLLSTKIFSFLMVHCWNHLKERPQNIAQGAKAGCCSFSCKDQAEGRKYRWGNLCGHCVDHRLRVFGGWGIDLGLKNIFCWCRCFSLQKIISARDPKECVRDGLCVKSTLWHIQ